MRSRGRIRLDGKVVADDATVFQGFVVKTGIAESYGRIHLLARGLAMIAYAICDLADATREHGRTTAPNGRDHPIYGGEDDG